MRESRWRGRGRVEVDAAGVWDCEYADGAGEGMADEGGCCEYRWWLADDGGDAACMALDGTMGSALAVSEGRDLGVRDVNRRSDAA